MAKLELIVDAPNYKVHYVANKFEYDRTAELRTARSAIDLLLEIEAQNGPFPVVAFEAVSDDCQQTMTDSSGRTWFVRGENERGCPSVIGPNKLFSEDLMIDWINAQNNGATCVAAALNWDGVEGVASRVTMWAPTIVQEPK